MDFQHKPVLLNEVIDSLTPALKKTGSLFIDGTLGLAGHSLALANKSKIERRKMKVIGIDKDAKALEIAKNDIASAGLDDYFTLIHDDFNNYSHILENLGISKVDAVLLDLGVSSMQLDDKSRGFSFQNPEVDLDMRMDQSQGLTAADIVTHYNQTELERMLKAGEERHYRKIAAAIVAKRRTKNITKVSDMLEILEGSLPKKYHKTHFATDTFRALRLEVNDELSRLSKTISQILDSLVSGGRLAIISFHSLEDRIVKNEFKRLENPCHCPPQLPHCVCGQKPKINIISRKPIIASEAELSDNPRARSAKLRIVEKL